MLTCEKVVQSMWEFLDRELTPEGLAELQKHIDLCRACYTRVEFEITLRENIRSKTDHPCPEKLKAKIRQIIELY